MTEPALVLDDVWVRDGAGGVLVRGISASIAPGAALVVIGETGSGKSLLAQAVLGLLPPGLVASGHIRLPGAAPVALSRPDAVQALWARQLAFLPQRTLRRHFADLAEMVPGLDLAIALPRLLDRLRLRAGLLDRRAGEISGGEAQRLARLLLLDPAVIVADEPTSRLDPIVQRETLFLLRELADDGLAVVLVSHDRAVVRALADGEVRLG